MHPLTKPSSFLFALSFLFSPVASHRNLPRNPHVHPHLDERLLPITATTTVVVQRTATHTVWVQPTEQAPVVAPGVGGNGGGAGDDASSSSTSESGSSISSSATVSSSSSSGSSSTSSGFESALASPSFSSQPTTIASSTSEEAISMTDSSQPTSTYISDSPSSSFISSFASATIDASSSYSSIYSTDFPASSTPSSISPSVTDTASESSVTDSSNLSISSSGSVSASTMLSSSSSKVESSSMSTSTSASASSTSSAQTASVTDSETSPIAASETPSLTASETVSSTTNETASLTASETGSITAEETESVTSTILSLTASSTMLPNMTSTLSSEMASSTSSNLSLSESTSLESTSTVSSVVSVTASLTSTSAAATSSSSNLETLGSTLMNAYYPDWSGYYLSPESVDWSKFDVIDFAFALPTADYGLEFTQDDSADLLKRLVSTGHAAGKRVKLSIGGWTGSQYFSTICGSSSNRKTFVKNILAAYNLYNLDGIDIDWEYPGTTGADGNAISSNDSANFLLFLQDLRAALPSGALISTATQVWPFAGSDGRPMSDVSEFAKVIDWILIMNYDVWGSSTTPGANAPLSDGCGNSTQPLANAYAAVSSWTGAGMPANQITLGVPAYGYLQKSSASQLKDRRRALHTPPHKLSLNSTLHSSRASHVTVYNDYGGSSDGQVMFESLISQGALTLSDGEYIGSGGFERYWDSCSSTPWIKSSSSGQIITYDDTQSMNLKGQFAAHVGLRGCNVFSIDGDWTGSSYPLTDAVRSGLGL
ncbi:uncharacterized protein IL334_007156 [Kwoniella shivajii]|uniref:GH18 domain-containing protein n=1 Tax=Kwoniella shivajii TaxID=564305 RepID=A0ABZ1D7X4_9TREE|nr:hypothetical protein IL334_007156 [Kwoniella shivajii]